LNPFWGHISGADQDPFTKFGVCVEMAEIFHDDTYDGPRRTAGVNVETGSRIPPPGAVSSNSFFGSYLGRRSRYLHRIWRVRGKWAPATCVVVHVRRPRISKIAGGGQVQLAKSLL